MASIIGHGISALFSAFAFSGAGLLFKHLEGNDYKKEMARHNRAVEELTKAKEAFNENEMLKHDAIEKKRQELKEANANIDQTNKALDALRKVTVNNKVFTREPKLEDFYHKSPKMLKYEKVFIGLTGAALGLGLTFL